MEKRDKRLILSIILVPILGFAMAAVYGYLTRDEAAIAIARKVSRPLSIEMKAPDFTFSDMGGRKVSLSEFRGKKVVFVNMWATWCPPCIWEMPSMEKLYKELGGGQFEILAVSIDALGPAAIKPFLKSRVRVSFPILLDPRGSIKKLYRTTGVPETFIVDKRGILVKKVIGPLDWSKPGVMTYFRKLIAQNGAPGAIRNKPSPKKQGT